LLGRWPAEISLILEVSPLFIYLEMIKIIIFFLEKSEKKLNNKYILFLFNFQFHKGFFLCLFDFPLCKIRGVFNDLFEIQAFHRAIQDVIKENKSSWISFYIKTLPILYNNNFITLGYSST